MVKAPTPGVGKRAAEAESAKSILSLVYDDEKYSLAWQNIPMGERLVCRKATGLPFESFTTPLGEDTASSIGEDSLCVLWWMARRSAGEIQLTFKRASEEWDASKLGDVDVEAPDPGSDDPES